MTELPSPGQQPHEGTEKPVETQGYTQPPRRPASLDLRFVVEESLKFGLRVIGEIDRALQKLNR